MTESLLTQKFVARNLERHKKMDAQNLRSHSVLSYISISEYRELRIL